MLDPEAPPLQQVFWKDSPLNITMLVRETELAKAREVLSKMSKAVEVGEFNVVGFCDEDAPLYEGGSKLVRELGVHCDVVAKVHRLVALVTGIHAFAWHIITKPRTREGGGEPMFKVVRLLAPGTEPRQLFVDIPPPPKDLWAVSVPVKEVGNLLGKVGKTEDEVVLLQGPLPKTTRWVLLRNLSKEEFQEVEQEFYKVDGAAFCTDKVYEGKFGRLCGGGAGLLEETAEDPREPCSIVEDSGLVDEGDDGKVLRGTPDPVVRSEQAAGGIPLKGGHAGFPAYGVTKTQTTWSRFQR